MWKGSKLLLHHAVSLRIHILCTCKANESTSVNSDYQLIEYFSTRCLFQGVVINKLNFIQSSHLYVFINRLKSVFSSTF